MKTGNSGKITDWVNPNDKSGEFKRQTSAFRNFISRETGAEFPPEKGRYHLYVSYACPWGQYKTLPLLSRGSSRFTVVRILTVACLHTQLTEL